MKNKREIIYSLRKLQKVTTSTQKYELELYKCSVSYDLYGWKEDDPKRMVYARNKESKGARESDMEFSVAPVLDRAWTTTE